MEELCSSLLLYIHRFAIISICRCSPSVVINTGFSVTSMSELASVVLDKSPKDTATVSLFRSEIHENVCDTVKNSKQFNKKELFLSEMVLYQLKSLGEEIHKRRHCIFNYFVDISFRGGCKPSFEQNGILKYSWHRVSHYDDYYFPLYL